MYCILFGRITSADSTLEFLDLLQALRGILVTPVNAEQKNTCGITSFFLSWFVELLRPWRFLYPGNKVTKLRNTNWGLHSKKYTKQ